MDGHAVFGVGCNKLPYERERVQLKRECYKVIIVYSWQMN